MNTITGTNFNVEELVHLHREHLWLHITNHKPFETQEPPIIVSGKGCMVKDVHGREYLDGLSGGVWCVNAGYGQQTIIDAITNQLQQLPFFAGQWAIRLISAWQRNWRICCPIYRKCISLSVDRKQMKRHSKWLVNTFV